MTELASSKAAKAALRDWTPEQRQAYLKALNEGDWDTVSALDRTYTGNASQLTRNAMREEIAFSIEQGFTCPEDYDNWLHPDPPAPPDN